MQAPSALIQSWFASDDAATAIEYGLVAAGIAMAIITVVTQIGIAVEVMYDDVERGL